MFLDGPDAGVETALVAGSLVLVDQMDVGKGLPTYFLLTWHP